MKKYLYFTLIALSSVFFSCEKEEVGGTATQDVAGEWYVTFSLIDTDGDTTYAADLVDAKIFNAERGIMLMHITAKLLCCNFLSMVSMHIRKVKLLATEI